MQTSTRPRDTGASFAARRGHGPQLSISDDNHHVTEAIGYMYEEEEHNYNSRRESGTLGNHIQTHMNGNRSPSPTTSNHRSQPRKTVPRRPVPDRTSGDQTVAVDNGLHRPSLGRAISWERQSTSPSPPAALRERAPSDTATTAFPLSDIDYESSPAAVAQELSNLQALRRMSMDVAAAGDPDLPSLSSAAIPGMAPSPSASEDDSSRLFWVPARLHPELAPKEFKSFLESRAEQIRRRSGELSSFSSGQSSRPSSLGSLGSMDASSRLQRKKSMLSRQIDNSNGAAAENYRDGAERLERKRSLSKTPGIADPNLQELESLVNEDARLQRLSLEAQTPRIDDSNGDIILPSVPASGLKRSTRTTYRKGSQKGRGDGRLPYSKRATRIGSPNLTDDARADSPSSVPEVPPMPSLPSEEILNLASTLRSSGTSPETAKSTLNFSRPAPVVQSPSPPAPTTTFDPIFAQGDTEPPPSTLHLSQMRQWQSHLSDQDRTSNRLPPPRQPVPQIVETPPPPEPPQTHSHPFTPHPPSQPPAATPSISYNRLPERTSSREEPKTPQPQRAAVPTPTPVPAPVLAPAPASIKQPSPTPMRPSSRGPSMGPQSSVQQHLDHMSVQASAIPGMDTNTANLSFIPTLTEDKKADNKKTKDKKDEPRKSSWGWLLGKEDSEKERRGDAPAKLKAKISRPPEKHDSTRLDVLQASIDGAGKGRESLVIDRESLKLEEERRRESQRRSTGSDGKKEKDGIFSSFFGGGKKKSDKESKKHGGRGLSPEPPHRDLKPDVDYNWTRFSILEERAIYRMAHIKLANPRRALHSQVLLSNFMYSYLAKVQEMHPQPSITSGGEQQPKKVAGQAEQPDEFTQYQRYQKQQQEQQLQHAQQPQSQLQSQPSDQTVQQQSYGAPQASPNGDVTMYGYDEARPSSRGSKQGLENGNSYASAGYQGHQAYQQQGHQVGMTHGEDDDEDMW